MKAIYKIGLPSDHPAPAEAVVVSARFNARVQGFEVEAVEPPVDVTTDDHRASGEQLWSVTVTQWPVDGRPPTDSRKAG